MAATLTISRAGTDGRPLGWYFRMGMFNEPWMQVRLSLFDDPRLLTLAERLGLDIDTALGKVLRFWGWVNRQLSECCARGATPVALNRMMNTPDFAEAMCEVGWLEVSKDGILIPEYDKWNSQNAKRRRLAAQSMLRARRNKRCADVAQELRPKSKRESKKHKSPSDSSASTVAGGKSTPSKATPRTPPTGPHHEFIDAFTGRWQAQYGAKYPFNGGKDATAAQWVREHLGDDPARWDEVLSAYFADTDDFAVKHRHGLGFLRSQLQRYLVPPAGGRGRAAESPGMFDGIAAWAEKNGVIPGGRDGDQG